jgi:hypothetical protein
MIVLDINTKNRATTQYQNFCFTSMVRFGERFLGASDDGLFELAGSDDNSVEISAGFKLPTSDFGIENLKRLRFMYFGLEATGDLEIEIVADEGTTRTYDIALKRSGRQQRVRIPIGRDINGRYFSFEIRNKSGCDFSLDSIKLLPVVRSHGHW